MNNKNTEAIQTLLNAIADEGLQCHLKIEGMHVTIVFCENGKHHPISMRFRPYEGDHVVEGTQGLS